MKGTRQEAVARLHSAMVRLLRAVRSEDPAMGLSPARASVLSVLVFGGARTMSELASAEQVSAPTMTRLIDGLERDGYVKRSPRRSDRRVIDISATAKARRVLERGRERRIERMMQLLEELDSADWQTLEAAVAVLESAAGHNSEMQARRHFARRRRGDDA